MDLVVRSLFDKFKHDHDLAEMSDSDAFEAFAGYCVLSSFFEDDFDPESFRTGGGNDLGIDVFGIMINGDLLHDAADVRDTVDQVKKLLDVRVVIVQAKTSAGFEAKVISDLAENLTHVLGSNEIPYPTSSGIDNVRACLRAVYKNIPKLASSMPRLHVRYVTTGDQVAEMIDQKARSAEATLSKLDVFGQVELRCVTRHELRDLYQRASSAVSATIAMPKRIILSKIPGVEQSFQGLVSVKELIREVLTDSTGGIRKTLFIENVRDFQGYNEVNKKIRETLVDPVGRQRFAVLNNGITIVTRELTLMGEEFHLRDFQIVNGCQSCHVIFDQRAEFDDDSVQVTLRIVHSQDDEIIRGIVAATNRQTAVTEDDLSAREQYHKDLEDYFAAQDGPRRLYYERRSKQYSEHEDVEKTRIINRTQLGRAFLAMFLNEPAGVGRYKALVETRKGELFVDGQPHALYYTAAATYYRIEWLIRNNRIPRSLSPARYHLLAAIRLRLLGPSLQLKNAKAVAADCERVLKVAWNANAAEKLVLDLLPPIKKAIDVDAASGVPISELVRTQRFAERVRAEILNLST